MVRRAVTRRPPLFDAQRRAIWTDGWAIALVVTAIALDIALAFVLWQRYDQLPELIAIHYNAYGEVDLIGGKSEIFKLPLIAAVVWASNAALAVVTSPHDRVLARLALGAAVLVQALFCVAAWRIVV